MGMRTAIRIATMTRAVAIHESVPAQTATQLLMLSDSSSPQRRTPLLPSSNRTGSGGASAVRAPDDDNGVVIHAEDGNIALWLPAVLGRQMA